RRWESSVGLASPSRMCTWIMAAPARSQSRAVATNSSSVTGRLGTSALACSAPVGATVINVPWAPGRLVDGDMPPILSPVEAPGGLPAEARGVGRERVGVDRRGHGVVAGAGGQLRVERDGALDHRERDRPELVVPRDRADPADDLGPERHRLAGLREQI